MCRGHPWLLSKQQEDDKSSLLCSSVGSFGLKQFNLHAVINSPVFFYVYQGLFNASREGFAKEEDCKYTLTLI